MLYIYKFCVNLSNIQGFIVSVLFLLAYLNFNWLPYIHGVMIKMCSSKKMCVLYTFVN